ncbi:MAG: efflux RND transporter periplasmic adaptor subunit [Archangium sp.]|nr:efflux RND transporter periplasmic adaptor subunit [Archangium sp.]
MACASRRPASPARPSSFPRNSPMRTSELLLLVSMLLACTEPVKPVEASTISSDGKSVTLTADAPQWRYIELSTAEQQTPLAALPVPGRVDLDEKRTSSVGAPLAGRVESVEVRLGARVKQGDRLFSVRSAAWADLDRETEGARAQVAVRQRLLERARELFELKASAQKDMLAAEAELHEAELTLKAAEAKQRSLQVQSAGDNLFWVRAPRSGTVVELDVYTGQEVTPDRDKPLMRLSDLEEVLVIADLPEGDVVELSVGEQVSVLLQGGTLKREGTIEYISEVVDPRRRTVEVRVRAKNADRVLRPNAFVEVIAEPDSTLRVVTVPDAAIVTQGKQSILFVARDGGRLEPLPVVVGRRNGGRTEVRRGLEPGAKFVSRGALLLLNQVELSRER